MIFSGCVSDDRVNSRNEITIQYIGDERIFFQDYWGMEASYLMFLSLTKPSPESEEYVGVLAKNWEYSDDFKTWTFHLNDNFTWHDGHPVTAHDIQFTHELRNHEIIANGLTPPFQVKAADNYTVEFTFPEPVDGVRATSWYVYYPRHILEKLDPLEFFNWSFWVEPIGNGPYRYSRHQDKTMVEIVSYENFNGKKPNIMKATLKFTNTTLTELYSGNVDALTYVTPDIKMRIDRDPNYEVYTNWFESMDVLYWNHNHPFFKSANVRKALTHAIDRNAMAQILDYPKQVPVMDGYLSPNQLIKKDYPPSLDHNIVLAKALLDEEGWIDTNGDGIVEKDGLPFIFEVMTTNEYERSLIFIKEQLKKVGVVMNLKLLSLPLLRSTFSKDGDFEALVLPAAHNFSQPKYGIEALLGETSPFHFNNAHINELLDEIQKSSPLELDEKFDTLNSYFRETVPFTMLLPKVQNHVVHKDIGGLENFSLTDPVLNLPELYWKSDS